ncbi:MAG TPA: sulfite exporter TauE/SafE family protein [Kofleriaceae bacterium]
MDSLHLALVGLAAAAGGAVNAIAGGGSLITFPALVACGVPPVLASATNTVAMCPGYLGATYAQRRELSGQRARILRLIPAGAIGGVIGALLLLHTDPRVFGFVVPFLLLAAILLLGFQDQIKRRLHNIASEAFAPVITGLAAIYGGYFGAGLGVIILAALAIVIAESLTRLNALKQLISLVVNVTAAIVFLAIAPLDPVTTLVMAACSLVGGVVGGRIASRISAKHLRYVVLALGSAIAIDYFAKLFGIL